MTVSFKGTAVSYPIYGNNNVTQNLFTLENGTASRVNVVIRRVLAQNDCTGLLTSVMPLIKTSIATALPTGGMVLDKGSFDTTKTSDSNVIARGAILSGNNITATAGNIIWEKYTVRLHSAYAEVIATDETVLPSLVMNVSDRFMLYPGTAILVQAISAAAASNDATSNNWCVQCVWDEEEIGTYAISGTVTLNGNPVSGAKIIVMEAADESMTNASLVEVKTTNAIGQWSSTICNGRVGAAFVQYKDGGVYYTAPGSPFLGP